MYSIGFEKRSCASKKVEMGGGHVSTKSDVHMTAALAGCRVAFVGTAEPFLIFSETCRGIYLLKRGYNLS